jgi:predicted nucleic acid-binding protein
VTAVVDASVLVAALVDSGSEGRWATTAISEHRPLAAPELVPAEACNILRRLESARHLSGPQASAAQRDLLSLDMECYPFAPFAERVWALRANLTCYDAWYVALAEALDCPLLTLDRRIGGAGGPECQVILPPAA